MGRANYLYGLVGPAPIYGEGIGRIDDAQQHFEEGSLKSKGDAGAFEDDELAGFDNAAINPARFDAFQFAGASDSIGRQRLELESQLSTQERAIDPDDTATQQGFEATRSQTLANFGVSAKAQQATSGSNSSGGGQDVAGNLLEASRKLDDVATKFEKVLSNAKTVVLVKD